MLPVYVYDRRTKKKVYVGQAPNEKAARRLEAKMEEEINGDHAAHERGWTVDRFAEHFLKAYHGEGTTRPEPTTHAHNETTLRQFRKEYGTRKLSSITREEAHQWAAKKPHQAKVISAMFGEAVDKHGLPANPFRGLGHKSRGRADITPLTEQEIARLVEISRMLSRPDWLDFTVLIQVAAGAGLRPGELCGLEWAEVDLGRGLIFVEWQRRNNGSRGKTKTKQNRVVPIAPDAIEALRSLSKTRPEVFLTPFRQPMRPNALRHYWNPIRAVFTSELPMDHWLPRRLRHDPKDHLDFYEIRHAYGSMLADRGLSARDISEVMGNSVRVCEEVYIHPYTERVQDRVRRALTVDPVSPLRQVTGESREQVG
jgi:integrase